MKSVCVFLGSSPGNHPDYEKAAISTGREIAERKLTLVFGGAAVGLMQTIAGAALEAGGDVIGVIPEDFIRRGIEHKGLTELIAVPSMHERKKKMIDLADAFIAMPGGLGTLEETFEVVTWAQIGLIKKPCGLLNIRDYYRHLIAHIEHCIDQGFIKPQFRALLQSSDSPGRLLNLLADPALELPDKWS